jgi:uncharacterized membrane protein YhdT
VIAVVMIVWVVAAIALWRHAEAEGTAGWWRWLALAVGLPLVMFVVGHEISKATRRR